MDASITETVLPVPLENILLWETTAFSNSAVHVQFSSTLSETEILHETARH